MSSGSSVLTGPSRMAAFQSSLSRRPLPKEMLCKINVTTDGRATGYMRRVVVTRGFLLLLSTRSSQSRRLGMSPTNLRLERLPAVVARTGMSRSWIYKEVAAGRFPKPVKVGGASGWDAEAIDRWIDSLIRGPAPRSGTC